MTSDLTGIVERLDHVAVGVNDLASFLPLVELMGGSLSTGGDNIADGFRWSQFDLPGGSKLEVIQPLDPEDDAHFLVRFLSERGPGVHHLTFKVTDLLEAVDKAEALGFEVVGVSTDGWWKEAFLRPRSAHGVLVQLAQWDEWQDGRQGDVTIDQVLSGAIRFNE
ncbi:MAG: VOC family protein [Acidimicrobiia bacterium]|nr:VOC family protein [Acidimicrobiia bacterium]MDH3469690.1 VOC family protein [Acidimicrobiia bacterium]